MAANIKSWFALIHFQEKNSLKFSRIFWSHGNANETRVTSKSNFSSAPFHARLFEFSNQLLISDGWKKHVHILPALALATKYIISCSFRYPIYPEFYRAVYKDGSYAFFSDFFCVFPNNWICTCFLCKYCKSNQHPLDLFIRSFSPTIQFE